MYIERQKNKIKYKKHIYIRTRIYKINIRVLYISYSYNITLFVYTKYLAYKNNSVVRVYKYMV